jgi:hypothetical protein
MWVVLFLSGCAGYESTSFNETSYKYSDLTSNAPVEEVRVFMMKDTAGHCPMQSTNETAAALIPVAVWGVKELLALGKAQLEKRAEYLESDIKLTGRLTVPGNWPPSSVDPKTGLCVLLVAGTYSGNVSGTDVLEGFRQAQRPDLEREGLTGFEATINQYRLPVPGKSPIIGPFNGMTKDPAFILEARISVMKAGDGSTSYAIVPTYLFYPLPLHKMTSKKLARALSVNFTLADTTASLSLDKFKSGGSFEANQLKTRYALAQSATGQPFGALGIVVTEGPDKAPTAKVLRDLVAQEASINTFIDAKAAEKLAKIKADEEEKKAEKAKAAADE